MNSWRVERLLPIACILGALVLIGSEFTEVFRFVPLMPDESGARDALDAATGADRHSYAMLVLGLFAIGGTLIAIWAGSRAAAISVAASGLVALVLFLIVDLPDAGTTGALSGSRVGFVEVETVTLLGFWLGMAGAVVLAVCGGALATLSSGQLLDLRPGQSRSPGPDEAPGPGDTSDQDRTSQQDETSEPDGRRFHSSRDRAADAEATPSAEERSRARRETASRRSDPRPHES